MGRVAFGLRLAGAWLAAAVVLSVPCHGENLAIDSSVDVNSQKSLSSDVSGTLAPFGKGFEESGFRARLTGAYNSSRYIAGENPRSYGTSTSTEGDFLVGYAFVIPRFAIAAFAGPAVINIGDSFLPDRNVVTGKGVLTFYTTPTDLTMAYGSYKYSTSLRSYELQTKVGLKLVSDIYVGPEVTFSGGPTYSQTKIGAHLSGFKLGPIYFGLSGGAIEDAKLGWGQYAGVNVYAGF